MAQFLCFETHEVVSDPYPTMAFFWKQVGEAPAGAFPCPLQGSSSLAGSRRRTGRMRWVKHMQNLSNARPRATRAPNTCPKPGHWRTDGPDRETRRTPRQRWHVKVGPLNHHAHEGHGPTTGGAFFKAKDMTVCRSSDSHWRRALSSMTTQPIWALSIVVGLDLGFRDARLCPIFGCALFQVRAPTPEVGSDVASHEVAARRDLRPYPRYALRHPKVEQT